MVKTRYRSLWAAALIALFVVVMYQTVSISRSRALDDLQLRTAADLNRYVLSLQQELDRYKDLPKLLSSHSELINLLLNPGSDAGYRANLYLDRVNETIGASDTYLMDITGNTLAASNWDQAQTFVGRNFSFRPYFKDAMANQPGRYFALGTTSKKRGYFFSYPVEYRGRILGVVVVKIDLNDIEEDWSDPLTDILVTDDDGVVFISTRSEWKFRTLNPLPQKDLQRIMHSLRYGDHKLMSLQVIERQRWSDTSHLITLIDGERIDNKALDGVTTRQFLQQTREVSEAGLMCRSWLASSRWSAAC